MTPCTFFFFNDTATTEIYTLSLHDALPIWLHNANRPRPGRDSYRRTVEGIERGRCWLGDDGVSALTTLTRQSRSEEHTSELQSQSNLVCRLLLEKKKKQLNSTGAETDTTTS